MQTEPIHPAVRVGHVHLRVADLDRSIAFYGNALGLGVTADGREVGLDAAFLAAGDYHHHIGLNTWESAGASPPPPKTAALRHATIVLPDSAERDRLLGRLAQGGHTQRESSEGPLVLDPSGNALLLAAP